MIKKMFWIFILSLLMFFTLTFNKVENKVYAEVKTSDIKPLTVEINGSTKNFFPVINDTYPVPNGVKFYTKNGSTYTEITPSGSSVSMEDIGNATNNLSGTVYYYNPTSTNINCIAFLSISYNSIYNNNKSMQSSFKDKYGDYLVSSYPNCSYDYGDKTPVIFGSPFNAIVNSFDRYQTTLFLTNQLYNTATCYCYKASEDGFVTTNISNTSTYFPLACSFGVTATCYITYNGNNNTTGTVPTDSTTYRPDNNVTVLGNTGNLTKTGFIFGGWNTKNDGTGVTYAAGSTYTITEDTTLYALWLKNVSIDEAAQSATYNGSNISFEIKGTNKDIGSFNIQYKKHGDNDSAYTSTAPINVGSYDVKITRTNDSTYTSYTKEISNGLVINKKSVGFPTYQTLYYNGANQSPTFSDVSSINVTGTTTGKIADKYDCTLSLKDTSNTVWYDDTVADKTLKWEISKKVIATTDITWTNTEVYFNGTYQKPVGTFKDGVIVSGDTCTVDVLSSYVAPNSTGYSPNVELSNENYILSNNNPVLFYVYPLDITSSITFTNLTLRYDGTLKAPSISSSQIVFGYPCDGVFSGKETEVGTYTATLTGLTSTYYTLTANPQLTTQYTIIPTYLIEFAHNGSTGTLPNISDRYIAGVEIVLPYYTGDIVKEGMSFVGWNTSKDSSIGYTGSYIIKSTDIINNHLIFYPVFSSGVKSVNNKTYNVVFNNFDGNELKTGNYYLNDDYTLNISDTISIRDGETVNLYLNGYILNLNNWSFNVEGNFEIFDDHNSNGNVHYFEMNEYYNKWNISNDETDLSCKGGMIYNGNTSISVNDSTATFSCIGVNFIGNTNSAIRYESDNALYVKGCNFYGNSSTNGGAIEVDANANIYDSNFAYNIASSWGGAILARFKEVDDSYETTKILISGCTIKNNTSGVGALYVHNSIVTLNDTIISDNTSSSTGAGVLMRFDSSACLVEGTKITMADGSFKNIENIKEGDYVKTFDHFTGSYKSSKVYLVYKGENTRNYITLNFKSGNSLSISSIHDLFNKEKNTYVRITEFNYSSYIGMHFYNSYTNSYDELISVTKSNDKKEYYSIYTESTFNCIANNMLTLPDDVDFEYHIFEFNEDLSINQDTLNQDILNYGLLDFNDCHIVQSYDDFVRFNCQYYYIWLAKDTKKAKDVVNEYDNANQTPKAKILKKILGNSIITYDTYGNEIYNSTSGDENWLVICSGTVIKDNYVIEPEQNPVLSNLYMDSDGNHLKIVGVKDVNIGICNTSGTYIEDETIKNDYRGIINCDTDGYAIFAKYDSVDQNYNYSIEKGYSIAYNANGGTGSVPTDTKLYDEGETVSLASNTLAKTGFKFKGWSLNGTLNTELSSYSVDSDNATNYVITLYAVWQEKTEIIVTFIDSSNTYTDEYTYYGETTVYKYSSTNNLSDFIFKYDTGVEGEYTTTTPTTVGIHTGIMYRAEDDNYKAYSKTFNLNIGYKVIYNANGANGSVPTDSHYYGYGYAELITFEDPINLTYTGYIFDGWNTKADGSGISYKVGNDLLVESNLTIYAKWAPLIDEEPSSTNDYEVSLVDKTSLTNTYQWYKGSLKWCDAISSNQFNYNSGSVDGTSIVCKSFYFFGNLLNGICLEYTGDYSSAKLKFKSETTLSGITPNVDGYYIIDAEFIDDKYYFNISADTAFSITDIEIYTIEYSIISGETNKKIGDVNTFGYYKCLITSASNGKTYSSAFKTSKIEFDANTGSGTLPTTMYQLINRTINIPSVNTLTKTNYRLLGFNTNSLSTTALESPYLITGDTLLYAIWGDKVSISINENEQEYTYTSNGISFILKGTHKDLNNFNISYKINDVWTLNKPVNVGSYDVKINRDEDSTYASYTKSISNGLVISKAKVDEPTVNGTYTYTGLEQTVSLNGVESFMSTSSSLKGTNASDYNVIYTLDNNHEWNDGSDGIVSWTITKAQAVINVDTTHIVKTYGESFTLPIPTTSFGIVSCDKVLSDLVNANSYTVTYTVSGTNNYDGAIKTITVIINKAKVNEPSVNGAYTYTGLEQTVSLNGVESFMSTTSTLKGTNANDYNVIYTLDNNHEWNDGSDGIVSWTITKAQAVINVDTTPIVKIYGESITIPVPTTNFGIVTCDKVASDLVNPGSYTITYKVEETDNYLGDIKEVNVTIKPVKLEKKSVEDSKTIIEVTNIKGFDVNTILEVTLTLEENITRSSLILILNHTSSLKYNEKVGAIYDIKLAQIVGDTKTYIQPKEGETVTVKIMIPESMDINKISRILHVHSVNNIEEISFNAQDVVDGYIEIEVNSFSEFAIIYKTNNNILPIILIILGSLILLFIIVFILWKVEYDKAIKNDSLDSRKLKVFDFIFLFINMLFFKQK